MKQSHYRAFNVVLLLIIFIFVYAPLQPILSDQSWFQFLIGVLTLYAMIYIGFGSLFRAWLLLTFFPISLFILPFFRSNPYRKMACVDCHRNIQKTDYAFLARPSTSWLNRLGIQYDLFWTYEGTCMQSDCPQLGRVQLHQHQRHYVWVTMNTINDWKNKRQWQIYDAEDEWVKQHLVKVGRSMKMPT
jgi:hypothetical protein